ncbi:MAG: histidine phosphatase family protein [Alphaproteobacteria bacterium]|nr:histidine phosphatase family protein [Alphaproteobacteria bacterium]
MILIRHGQSEFNVVYGQSRIDPGIEDPQLTEEGRRQIEAAVDEVAALGARILISSPYSRALQTADIIAAALELPISVEPLVRERRAFTCDIGSPRSALAGSWPELDFDHLEEQWWSAGEEAETELLVRCARFQSHMASREDWRDVAVVSHWGFIRGLTGHTLGNGEIVRFDPT